ncbi:MAG: TIGR04282 family arsenosugar biosynthesis glycosyltransferase [Vicinamibacteria bacterium]|nr:TIGR04282 family arsenosugar biosynthesis glycosyltransferase [Vicinamibacteria bacterium]
MKPVRIVIFAKAPRPGFAKTRLIPALGAQGAADLACRLLVRAVREAMTAGVGRVELCVTPFRNDETWPAEIRAAQVDWTEQGDGDLGERLARVTKRVIDSGESVLLVGADCPELNAARLREAARSLRRCDATMFPTTDGGYALLGLRRFDASPFANMAWSTDIVAQETLRRLAFLKWTVETHTVLHDIDEPADLKWLPSVAGEARV